MNHLDLSRKIINDIEDRKLEAHKLREKLTNLPANV